MYLWAGKLRLHVSYDVKLTRVNLFVLELFLQWQGVCPLILHLNRENTAAVFSVIKEQEN